jgi:hypothetical protein
MVKTGEIIRNSSLFRTIQNLFIHANHQLVNPYSVRQNILNIGGEGNCIQAIRD